MTDLRTYLKSGKPLLFDGAMGTLFGENCEQANLTQPEKILAIHRAYLNAGANAIKTNTFGAGLHQPLIEAACRIAQEAAEPYGAYVFADLGPAPQEGNLRNEHRYIAQANLFLQCGVKHFLLETLSTDEGVAELAAHLKSHGAFLIVSFAVSPEGVTQDGMLGSELFRRTRDIADAVGFNCVSGPNHLLGYIRKLDKSGAVLSVMPNAGYPTILGRRTVFMGTPEYFGDQLAQIHLSGAQIIGGCCGTTPDHIRAAAQALENAVPSQPISQQPRQEHAARPNPLWEKLKSGQKIIAVELDPPVDDDLSFFMDGVKTLRDMGADVVTIADCPIGRPRADSSLLACKIKRELGIEPLPHMTCRDRNMNATKALLLGLSMEDVHNVLLVTGDPIPTAQRDEVKSVFNFNSRKLAQYVQSLNEEVLQTPFRIFGALNVNAKNFSVQLKLAQEKEACGKGGSLRDFIP